MVSGRLIYSPKCLLDLVTKKSKVGLDGKTFGCWSGQYFSVRPSNSVIKYRLMYPCIVDPTMKMPPHPAAMPISLYVGNTHNWPRPRGQLLSCINAGYRRILVYISPFNIQRINELHNVLPSSNFAVLDCCYFLCYWLQSWNWNLHKLLELPSPYNFWT